MKTIETQDLKYFIPIDTFNICLIDQASRKQITEMYPTRKDGAYYLDKFSNYIKDNYSISFKDYCKQYLKFDWPLCPSSSSETGYRFNGKGVFISTFAAGKISKEHCPKFMAACEKFSIERKGSGNPMFGKEPWNKGLDVNHPVIAKIAEDRKGKKTSDEVKLKQSESAKKRIVHGHTGKKHSPETIEKLRENTAQMYRDKKYTRVTGIEIKVRNFLIEQNIQFVEQYFFKYYSLDFALTDQKICIECQGQYFHSDPRFYPNGPISNVQRRNFGRDKAKRKYLKSKDWEMIELWEAEINDGQFKEILICKLKELKALEV